MARKGAVPEENPEAPSALHQTGADALPEGVSQPRLQAAAQGDGVGGAQVLASENSAAEDAGRRHGRAELHRHQEPRFTPPAFLPAGGCRQRWGGTFVRSILKPIRLFPQGSGNVVLQRDPDGTPVQWFVAEDAEIVSQV